MKSILLLEHLCAVIETISCKNRLHQKNKSTSGNALTNMMLYESNCIVVGPSLMIHLSSSDSQFFKSGPRLDPKPETDIYSNHTLKNLA